MGGVAWENSGPGGLEPDAEIFVWTPKRFGGSGGIHELCHWLFGL